MAFNTADRIISAAMVDAGLMAEGDTPTAAQYASYTNRLNDLINLWQTQGIKIWTQLDLPVTLVAGQAKYSVVGVSSTKPLRILADDSYYLYTANSVKRPVSLISRNEYSRLSATAQGGPVTQIWVDKQRLTLDVYCWLVPDTNEAANGALHVTIQQQIPNLVSSTDEVQFPQEWYMALRWGLADDICSGQPQAIMDRCAARSVAFREALEAWDVEDAATYFYPQMRGRV